MKKAIAMACTQEQYKAVKNKLKNIQKSFIDFTYVKTYLTNNFLGEINSITTVNENDKRCYNREVFETWNEKVFLEACGIETEPEYVITKSELDELKHLLADDSHSGHNLRIEITKNILPHLFKEDKVELETGKWYESNLGTLALYLGNESLCGISCVGVWNDNIVTVSAINKCQLGNWFIADASKVTEAFD